MAAESAIRRLAKADTRYKILNDTIYFLNV